MRPAGSLVSRCLLVAGLLFISSAISAQDNILEKEVKMPGNSMKVARALSEVANLTGYIFTYDTRIIDTEKNITLPSREVTIKQLLDSVTGNPSVRYSVIGKHIVLYHDVTSLPEALDHDTVAREIRVSGRVIDSETSEPLQYATVGISHRGRGTVSNNNGDFILKVDRSCLDDTLSVSYVGYSNRFLPVRSLAGNIMTISMERDFIPIQEIIIRAQDPLQIIRKTIAAIGDNYGSTPALLTGFYREGVYRKKEPQVYSEAVVQIYKSPYVRSIQSDQVKVLRSRKIENLDARDTLAVRLKAGLRSTLTLDGVRFLYDFLDPSSFNSYEYHLTDIVTIDNQTAYVISFKQKMWVTEPLMEGDVYINVDNFAVMLAEFQINPLLISRTSESYVSRLPHDFTMKPEYVRYRTRYRNINGRYFLSHVRGDLGFVARGKKRFFNSRFNVFFELAVTDCRTNEVSRFDNDEIAPVNAIFSSTITGYDSDYWKGFDFLKPEDDLVEALEKLNLRLGEFAE